MRPSKKRIACLSLLLSLSMAGSMLSKATAIAPPMSNGVYVPISMEEVRAVAKTELRNATNAGRLTHDQAIKFSADLDNATSLGGVEKSWADLESRAQVAKSKHVSLDHLLTTFTNKMSRWEKQKIATADQLSWYRDRVKGVWRIKKQLTAKDNFFDFWEFVTLAVDLSSLEERLNRALASYEPPLETLNERVMRTDNYIARNELCARMLTVYKSFEVEPDNIRDSRDKLYLILKDRSNSRLETPEVKQALYSRVAKIQYEGCKVLPSESDVDKAINEVQRLLDSGAMNGNLSAFDDVRLQHELEMVKQVKKAYPGPNPGIDPVERELRYEEMRFASLELRFLQDWLGRVLRKDGENVLSREAVYRLVRRIDLSSFSHRITENDVNSLLAQLNTALHDHTDDAGLIAACNEIQGRMDMMVSDYSMVPAKVDTRLKNLSAEIAQMSNGREPASAEKDRIQGLMSGADSMSAPDRFGMSIVASAEAEMLRERVRSLMKQAGITPRGASLGNPLNVATAPKPGE